MLSTLKTDLTDLENQLHHETDKLEFLKDQKDFYKSLKPGSYDRFWAVIRTIFGIKTRNSWKEDYNQFLSDLRKTRKTIIELKDSLHKTRKDFLKKEKKLENLSPELVKLQKEIESREKEIQDSENVSLSHLFTADFWDLTHEEQQLFSPQFASEAQKTRDDVFVAAIQLHKAFIDGAAGPLGRNLEGMMSILETPSLTIRKEDLAGSLWSSLFLVVSVISTTFASVDKMLKGISPEEFGWLLIDEAGQGTPQAAVGAIFRAKHVITVGDPLQVQPVTTLPNSLTDALAAHHGINPDLFVAPKASIQTLADQASKYGTTLQRKFENVRIGVPLLVHRRCENPMFSLCNELAYNNLMVYATSEKPSRIKDILGESKWFHVEGQGQDKWCPAEGEKVVEIMKQLFKNTSISPNIFIISPFRVVAQNMRSRLRREAQTFDKSGDFMNYWLRDHVGTVHTFQGKEAEAVIFVLGAPNRDQQGARNWATSEINLLNVAISRAKQCFYIVGNEKLWRDCGHMSLVSDYISSQDKVAAPPEYIDLATIKRTQRA